MGKDLNDLIEGFFKGIVFVIFDFVGSLVILLGRPISGCTYLIRKLHSKTAYQVRPYVFLFLSFATIFIAPRLLDSVLVRPDPYVWVINDPDRPNPSTLTRAYDGAFAQFETRTIWSISIAAIVGVSIYHFGAFLIGSGFFFRPQRRTLFRDSLFFVGGSQVFLVLFLFLFGPSYRPVFSLSYISVLKDLMGTFDPRTFFSQTPFPIWQYLLACVGVIVISAVPIPFAARNARRSFLASPFDIETHRTRFKQTIIAAVIVLTVDLTGLIAFTAAGYVADQTRPRTNDSFKITDASCSLETRGASTYIIGILVLSNPTSAPWLFKANDTFDFNVSAHRNSAEHPDFRRLRHGLDPFRISGGNISGTMVVGAFDFHSKPFLLNSGASILVEVEGQISSRVAKFLSKHPDDRMCSVFFNGSTDIPIGRNGPLTSAKAQ